MGPNKPTKFYYCLLTFSLLLVTIAKYQPSDAANQRAFTFFNPLEALENLYIQFNPNSIKGSPDERLMPLDWFLEDIFPRFINQQPNNENGSKWQYKEYAYSDSSNDDAIRLSGQELLTRSGYKFETYDAIADDGYITILTRIINPLADQSKLRQPPVLVEHGGTIDPTAYLLASSIQHHPEKWPRSHLDGPITSWNRSLAFVLANNGYDVWLAETRGANEKNTRHIKSKSVETVMSGANLDKNMTLGETIDQLLRQWTYYSFSMDDIIAHELKSHIDVVLQKTGAEKVHLFSFSLSTPTTLAFLSIRPDYAEKIQGYVSMAPIVSGQGVNTIIKVGLQTICPLIPDMIGGIHITDIIMTQPFRELIIWLAQSKYFRYSMMKSFIILVFGPSPKYGTNLELNLLGHMLRHLSFRLVKQMCQQTRSNKLQKYDYGPVKNKILYKTEEPPIYDLSDLKIKDWIVVAAANDKLATLEVMNHMIDIVNPKPVAKIIAPGFNHLDLIGAFENDKYVNIPILQYYNEMSNRYMFEHGEAEADDLQAAGARSFNIKSILPPQVQPEQLSESANNITRSLGSNISSLFNPTQFFSSIAGLLQGLGIGQFKKNIEEDKYYKN